MTIHTGHPFATPDEERDPVRRFRGRLGGGVTLWAAGASDDRATWSGLTVSSLLVAEGEPARLLALLDPESDLSVRLAGTGCAVVSLLGWAERGIAEMYAGTAPAPGGPFAHGEFEVTPWGPRLVSASSWVGVRLEDARPLGWSRLVTTVVERVEIGADDDPLGHRRGRWTR